MGSRALLQHVRDLLEAHDYTIGEEKDMGGYGVQLRLARVRAFVNIFDTGTVQVQGRDNEMVRLALDPVLNGTRNRKVRAVTPMKDAPLQPTAHEATAGASVVRTDPSRRKRRVWITGHEALADVYAVNSILADLDNEPTLLGVCGWKEQSVLAGFSRDRERREDEYALAVALPSELANARLLLPLHFLMGRLGASRIAVLVMCGPDADEGERGIPRLPYRVFPYSGHPDRSVVERALKALEEESHPAEKVV